MNIDLEIRALVLVKGGLATMTTPRFTRKARRALVPMRKATMDAFILTMLTIVCLTYLAIPVTHPLLFVLVIVLVFALVYGIAVVLRLRQAAMNPPAARGEWQATPIDNTAFTILKGWLREPRTPPEKY
jgi:hypothetical protein